jgi:site-specific DNA-cytosine methylase
LAGARSGLFHEQVRIWNESGAPYFLWENVLGALSSNAGSDFAVVLSTLVGAPLAVPADGWRRAGVAAGPSAVAAWRVLDLQHFGPPQRRVRVFILAARAGGVDPAEVLALREGVCGHPSPREQAREGTATSVGGGAAAGGDGRAINISNGEPRIADTFATLQARSKAGGIGSGQQMQAVLQHTIGIDQERNAQVELMGTLNTGSKTGGGQLPVVMAFESTGGSWGVNEGDTAPPIKIGTGLQIASPPAVVAFAQNQRGELRTSEVSAQITTGGGKPGEGYPAVVQTLVVGGRDKGAGDSYDNTPVNVQCVTGHVTHALTHEGADASEDGTGRGTPVVAYSRGGFGAWEQADAVTSLCARDAKDQGSLVLPTLPASLANSATGQNRDELVIAQSSQGNADFDTAVAYTLNTMHDPQYLVAPAARQWPKPIADTLTLSYATKWGMENQHIDGGAGLYHQTLTGRPRRLTPLECERLMSWPDQWTAVGVDEDGREYRLSDTARYRLCGNGVGSVQVQWIAERLADALRAG